MDEIRTLNKDKILTFPNIGTKQQRKGHYVAKAVKHPAIDLNQLRLFAFGCKFLKGIDLVSSCLVF